MAIVTGTAASDFIHVAGDGLIAPPGTLDRPLATILDDVISADNGDDWVYAGRGNDALTGGSGADYLDGGSGNDTMTGGGGDDTYVVDSLLDVVNETSTGNDLVRASLDFDLTGFAIERLTLLGSALMGTGNALANTLTGNVLDNTLSGLFGSDSLYGRAGNDSLSGGVSDDVLYGGDDSDTLNGGSGADALYGGKGSDLYYVDALTDLVSEVGGGGIDTVRSSVDFTLDTGFEDLLLTGTAQAGTGNAAANGMTGNAEGNSLSGLDGADRLTGGAGLDSIYGGAGNDKLLITGVAEVAAGEVYDGGADTDLLLGSSMATAIDLTGVTLTSIESIKGFANGLSLTGAQAAALSGVLDTGALTLTGGGVIDLSDTRILTDVINLTSASSLTVSTGKGAAGLGGGFGGTINGSAGADTITIIRTPNAQPVVINGGGDQDTIIGSAGAETIKVGASSTVYLGGGHDTVFAGFFSSIYVAAGLQAPDVISLVSNFLDIRSYGSGVVDLSHTTIIAPTSSQISTVSSFFSNDIILSATQFATEYNQFLGTNATITGSDGSPLLLRMLSFDFATTTLAEGGNPWNVTLTGAYVFNGFAPLGFRNTLLGAQTVTNTVTLIDTTSSFVTSLGSNTLIGGNLGDTLTSASGADRLEGRGGNDLLTGAGGIDVLLGETGNDTLDGGSQMDSLFGGNDDDLLRILATGTTAGAVLEGGLGTDTLNGTGASATHADLTGVTLTGIEALTGFAGGVQLTLAQLASVSSVSVGDVVLTTGGVIDLSAANVTVTILHLSDSATDMLVTSGPGGPGLGGFAGLIQGGIGNDTIGIGSGNGLGTTIDGGDGDDDLYTSVAATIRGGNGFDTVQGSAGQDTLGGGAGGDSIRGNGGLDAIQGGSGDDTVVGGGNLSGEQGNDRLTGGTGADTFAGGAGSDTVTGNTFGQSDLFIFDDSASGGSDRITGFKFGGAVTDAVQIAGGASDALYIGAKGFSGGGDTEVRYDGAGLFQVDIDADGNSDFAFTLVGVTDATDLDQSYFIAG